MERNRRIKAIQGKGNRFVEDYAALFGKTTSAPTLATPVPAQPASATPTATKPAANPSGWTCGAKTTCGQMGSCDEARFYLTTCGEKRLDGDGDGDGVPCAKLCNR